MLWPTTMMITMNTASSTRMQQIATATMLRVGLTVTGGGGAPPPRRLPARPHRDEILIRRPLAEVTSLGPTVTTLPGRSKIRFVRFMAGLYWRNPVQLIRQ
ncbi:hypothetical protein MTP99_014818 [Tenebrio molitor]|nr:hypothetical protein MTP99_014818 [Tenebrio molitor]